MSEYQRFLRPRFGTRLVRFMILGAVVLAAASATAVSATATATATSPSYTVTVQGNDAGLTNTGIAVATGAKVEITATGKIKYNSRGEKGDTRWTSRTQRDLRQRVSTGWYNANLNCLSLIGRFGSGEVFQVGDSTKIDDVEGGELYLIFNDNDYLDNSGHFTVTVTVT